MELLLDQGMIEELIEAFEHGSSVTTPPAKSGPVGNSFQQTDGDPVVQADLFTECLNGLHTEVIGSRGKIRIVTGEHDLLSLPVGDLNLIGKGKRNHEGLQFVESVGTFPEDPKRKVDLGLCRECDGMITTAHLSIV